MVDLSRVTFMDSTEISVLPHAVRRLTSRHRHPALVCPTASLLSPFKVAGLVAYPQISSSREEAPVGARREC